MSKRRKAHRVRITGAADEEALRELDRYAEAEDISRAEAVARAIEEFAARRLDEDREHVERVEERVQRVVGPAVRSAEEARTEAGMIYELLAEQFPRLAKEIPREELRRRTRNRRRGQ